MPEYHSAEDAQATPPTKAKLRWDDATRRDVVERGEQVMQLFARPSLSATAWWDDLEPLLSSQAREDYSGVDPARVPVTAVTGKASLVPLQTRMVAIVHVPTDAGLYAVTFSRTPQTPDWLVERITPPEPNPHAGD